MVLYSNILLSWFWNGSKVSRTGREWLKPGCGRGPGMCNGAKELVHLLSRWPAVFTLRGDIQIHFWITPLCFLLEFSHHTIHIPTRFYGIQLLKEIKCRCYKLNNTDDNKYSDFCIPACNEAAIEWLIVIVLSTVKIISCFPLFSVM